MVRTLIILERIVRLRISATDHIGMEGEMTLTPFSSDKINGLSNFILPVSSNPFVQYSAVLTTLDEFAIRRNGGVARARWEYRL
jgi:hypothetical protein